MNTSIQRNPISVKIIRSSSFKKKSRKPQRRLILLDIENYCRKGDLSEQDVSAAKSRILDLIPLKAGDLLIIGTSHESNFTACCFAWPGARVTLKRGHDGADMALIEAARQLNLKSFAAVILISGDGIFSSIVQGIRTSGIPVMVVANKTALSGKLSNAASRIRLVRHHSPIVA